MRGKIVKGIGGFYYVDDGHGRVYACRARGVFRSRGIKPLVGDNVEFLILDEAEGEGSVEEILPRANALVRPSVANVDQAFVLFALCRPEPNLNLLDRFLVMMELAQVPVTVCFNKCDLADGKPGERYRGIYEGAGYRVLTLSTVTGEGMEEARGLLRGRTTVLAGPSGVGKSSFTNRIQPRAAMETGDISRKIERGRHTTRHSELFFVEEGTYVMDTPGFSSIFPPELEAGRLKELFPEFAPWEEECRFLGCVHLGERECGVKQALALGKIASSRYENYRLLYEELKNKRRY